MTDPSTKLSSIIWKIAGTVFEEKWNKAGRHLRYWITKDDQLCELWPALGNFAASMKTYYLWQFVPNSSLTWMKVKWNCRKAFLFMQSMGCCGLGTNLPDVSLIIVHDSDWNPRADIQAINRCHRAGSSKSGVPIFRLVINGTIEEKLMQMSENAVEMEAVYAAGIGNRSAITCSLLILQIESYRLHWSGAKHRCF